MPRQIVGIYSLEQLLDPDNMDVIGLDFPDGISSMQELLSSLCTGKMYINPDAKRRNLEVLLPRGARRSHTEEVLFLCRGLESTMYLFNSAASKQEISGRHLLTQSLGMALTIGDCSPGSILVGIVMAANIRPKVLEILYANLTAAISVTERAVAEGTFSGNKLLVPDGGSFPPRKAVLTILTAVMDTVETALVDVCLNTLAIRRLYKLQRIFDFNEYFFWEPDLSKSPEREFVPESYLFLSPVPSSHVESRQEEKPPKVLPMPVREPMPLAVPKVAREFEINAKMSRAEKPFVPVVCNPVLDLEDGMYVRKMPLCMIIPPRILSAIIKELPPTNAPWGYDREPATTGSEITPKREIPDNRIFSGSFDMIVKYERSGFWCLARVRFNKSRSHFIIEPAKSMRAFFIVEAKYLPVDPSEKFVLRDGIYKRVFHSPNPEISRARVQEFLES